MEIRYAERAAHDFEKLPHNVQKRIAKKMRFYISQRDPLKLAKRLTNIQYGEYRFRIGDYQIFFDVVKKTIFVLKIIHRREAYK